MASEHSVFSLVERVQSILKSKRSLMEGKIVVVHQELYYLFSFLLIDFLLPDTEDIKSTTLIVRASERIFIVPVTLTIIKRHQTRLLEYMVSSDCLYDLTMGRNSFPICLLKKLIFSLLEFEFIHNLTTAADDLCILTLSRGRS